MKTTKSEINQILYYDLKNVYNVYEVNLNDIIKSEIIYLILSIQMNIFDLIA